MAQIKYNLGDLSKDKYSTDEIKIGTWIDGKPIYRRVFQRSGVQEQIEIENLENVIKCDWSQTNSGMTYFNYNCDGGSHSMVRVSNGKIDIYTTNSFVGKPITIIVEHTKKTDV